MLTPIRHGLPTTFRAFLATLPLLVGCGSGTAALVAGSDDDGSSGPPPALSAFTIQNPKVSPAVLRLEASAGLAARLSFALPGDPEAPMTLRDGTGPVGPDVQLPAGASELRWDFAHDLGGAEFEPVVDLFVRHANGTMLTGGSLRLGMGNDPPVVLAVEPMPTDPARPSESSGNVDVSIAVRDSSSDVVSVLVEWRRASDAPDAWQPATAAGTFPERIETDSDDDGVRFSFFWNTNADLAAGDDDVLLRVVADDGTLDPDGLPIGRSAPVVSALLHVDNNEAPIVQIHGDALVSNPDALRGIPVPFTVLDGEGDEVTVVFQWRREGEAFPPLPGSTAAIQALLGDADARRELQVCSEYPRVLEGTARALDPLRVRLKSDSPLDTGDVVGRELRFPRPPQHLDPVSDAWPTNPLAHPIGAVPWRGGTHALVLDDASSGWRLVEVALTDGTIERTVATGIGLPSALCAERGGAGVLVASHGGATWSIARIDVASGTTVLVANGTDGAVEHGEVRGVASLGAGAAVLTVGSSLLRASWSDAAPARIFALFTGLATPWGVAGDPHDPALVYVAEHSGPGGGRVLAVDVVRLAVRPIAVAAGADGRALPAPRGVALLRRGTRLVALCDDGAGGVELRGVELGVADWKVAWRMRGAPGASAGSLASDPEHDCVLASSASDRRLAVAGGLRARATVESFDRIESVATLAGPLAPTWTDVAPWSLTAVAVGPYRAQSSPSGVRAAFNWNSADAVGGGRVYLRATPLDAEVGTGDETIGTKVVRHSLADAAVALPAEQPVDVLHADLDGDGDLDLASADLGPDTGRITIWWQTRRAVFGESTALATKATPVSLAAGDIDGDGFADLVAAFEGDPAAAVRIFWQVAPGSFDDGSTGLGGSSNDLSPTSMQVADLDGDMDLDLLCTSFANHDVRIFWQSSPGLFEPTPTVLGGSGTTEWPVDAEAADLDGDGDLDIVSANTASGNLAVFWQVAAGAFDPVPTLLSTGEGFPVFADVVEPADLDGDGDIDLTIMSGTHGPSFNGIAAFWQVGPGEFAAEPTVLAEVRGLSLQTTDADGDRDLDIVIGTRAAAAIYLQIAPGTFEPTPWLVDDLARDLVAGDLDSDGDVDLVAAGQGGSLDVSWQHGVGSFEPAPEPIASMASPALTPLVDLDRDGDLDLPAWERNVGGQLKVFRQTAPGIFDLAPLEFPVFGEPWLGDLDADGDIDLVTSDSSAISVFWQTSSGVFDPDPTAIATPGRLLQVIDLDGDADLDLTALSSVPPAVTAFRQTSAGVFEPVGPFSGVPPGASPLSWIDLDDDGRLDLLISVPGSPQNPHPGSSLSVLWREGSESFDPVPTAFVTVEGTATCCPSRIADLEIEDVDGDGDLDLLWGFSSFGFGERTLHVLYQEAPRSFAAMPVTLGSPGAVSLHLLDVDGDGRRDVATANVTMNLTVFWQTSAGVFDPQPTMVGNSTTSWAPQSLRMIDIDSDGDLDLVSIGTVDVSVFRQTSPRAFDPVPFQLGGGFGVNSASIVDVDGDGERDVTCATSQNLSVHWALR